MAVLRKLVLAVVVAASALQCSRWSVAAAQAPTVPPPQIRILEPAPGTSAVEGVWVRGVVENGGREVALTIPLPPVALIPVLPVRTEAGTFAAFAPVLAGTNAVTINATDVMSGAMSSVTVPIVVVVASRGPIDPLSALSDIGLDPLKAYPEGGFAPHTVRFEASTLPPGVELSLDIDADGTVDFTGPTFAGRSFVYARPGIYLPLLRVTTADRNVSTYRTIVEVYDRAALEARLQAIWSGFTEALRRGDPGRAVTFIHSQRRGIWLKDFSQLTTEQLAVVGAQIFTPVRVVRVGAGGAEYEMLREEGGQLLSYPVVFIADADGRWRLWQF